MPVMVSGRDLQAVGVERHVADRVWQFQLVERFGFRRFEKDQPRPAASSGCAEFSSVAEELNLPADSFHAFARLLTKLLAVRPVELNDKRLVDGSQWIRRFVEADAGEHFSVGAQSHVADSAVVDPLAAVVRVQVFGLERADQLAGFDFPLIDLAAQVAGQQQVFFRMEEDAVDVALVTFQFPNELSVRIPELDEVVIPSGGNQRSVRFHIQASHPAFVSFHGVLRLRLLAEFHGPVHDVVIAAGRHEGLAVRQDDDVPDPAFMSFPGDLAAVVQLPPLQRVVF